MKLYELTPAFLKKHMEDIRRVDLSILRSLPDDYSQGIVLEEQWQEGEEVELLPGLVGKVDNYCTWPGTSEVWYCYADAMAILEGEYGKA